jgi:hypothetical protein
MQRSGGFERIYTKRIRRGVEQLLNLKGLTMEIKLPDALEKSIMLELEHRPGLDKRQFVLEAIRQHVNRCAGNRKRAEMQRKERGIPD